MVAYGFKKRFVPLIESGAKTQTIRAEGKRRHAEPGERLQIYTGMRTKSCRKVIPDPICTTAERITIEVPQRPDQIAFFMLGSAGFEMPKMIGTEFAVADGFKTVEEFLEFFIMEHRPGKFVGRLIKWE